MKNRASYLDFALMGLGMLTGISLALSGYESLAGGAFICGVALLWTSAISNAIRQIWRTKFGNC